MEKKFTPEQIEKAKECKSVEELLALAQGNGIEITEAEATNYFAKLNPENCELADSELETVAGGGFCDPCPAGGNHVWEYTGRENGEWNEECEWVEKRCPKCGKTTWMFRDGAFEGT